jgi:hypothetical protein
MPKTSCQSAPQVAVAAMEHVFAMRDGKVLADVKKTVSDGILKVRGFVNNTRINTTKKLKGGQRRGTRRARRTRRRRRTY